jgi:hypothetical protein
LVETRLIRSNGDPVALNYLFRSGADGSWKIIDVYFSGAISEMARMRSDFSATVTGGGCEAVVKELAIRNEAMVVSSLCVCIVLVCRENCFGGGKTVVKKADGGTQT